MRISRRSRVDGMWEASWLLLGSCLGSRLASLWRPKYLLLSLHSCHITSFIPDKQSSRTHSDRKLFAFGLLSAHLDTMQKRMPTVYDSPLSRLHLPLCLWGGDGKQVCSEKMPLYSCFPQQCMRTLLQLMGKIWSRLNNTKNLPSKWDDLTKSKKKKVLFGVVYIFLWYFLICINI